MLTDGRTAGRMDNGRKVITIAHPEQSSGELKKKKLQETSVYCVLLRMKQVTYKGSTVIPTSSSLEMIQVLWVFFFQKIVINLLK